MKKNGLLLIPIELFKSHSIILQDFNSFSFYIRKVGLYSKFYSFFVEKIPILSKFIKFLEQIPLINESKSDGDQFQPKKIQFIKYNQRKKTRISCGKQTIIMKKQKCIECKK